MLADDIIYNRFDILFEDYMEVLIDDSFIQIHIDGKYIEVNLWGKDIDNYHLGKIVDYIVNKYPKSYGIKVERIRCNYEEQLYECEDIFVDIPIDDNYVIKKLKSKNRHNIQKKMCRLSEQYGKITSKWIPLNKISDSIVEQFYLWKYEKKGRKYEITAHEYLEKYHVTEAVLIFCGTKCLSINFFCRVNKTAYLENMAFNMKYKEYSPGLIGYYLSLCELSRRNCERLYLGGGKYQYKKMFSSEINAAFSGIIYSDYFFDLLNNTFRSNEIDQYYIFGGGRIGQAFLKNRDRIMASLKGVIDFVRRDIDGIRCIEWNKQTIQYGKCIIFTMHECENSFLKEIGKNFDYVYCWNDMSILE